MLVPHTCNMMTTATIVFVSLSGGFWGLKGDDGVDYCPVSPLPAHLCREGLRVRAWLRGAPGYNVYMWGRLVQIEEIESLSYAS